MFRDRVSLAKPGCFSHRSARVYAQFQNVENGFKGKETESLGFSAQSGACCEALDARPYYRALVVGSRHVKLCACLRLVLIKGFLTGWTFGMQGLDRKRCYVRNLNASSIVTQEDGREVSSSVMLDSKPTYKCKQLYFLQNPATHCLLDTYTGVLACQIEAPALHPWFPKTPNSRTVASRKTTPYSDQDFTP